MSTKTSTQTSKWTTYQAYKDSGIEWLGEIPEGWQVKRLKYSSTLMNQKIDGSKTDLQYTGLENIQPWTGKRITSDFDTGGEGQSNTYMRGDILFGKLRPYLAKALIANEDGICTGELLVLRPGNINTRFLLNYLLTPNIISIVDSSTYGAKMPRANWDFIGNLPTLLPPKHEQTAIATFLDRETSQIDALIEKKKRQIELLKEKRSALISHAVTKGLDPKAKMKDSGIEWMGEIPEVWEIVPIRSFARSGYKTFTDGDWIESPYIRNDGIRLIQTGNIGIGSYKEQGYRYIDEETFNELRCTEVIPEDVLICRLADPVGRACQAPNLNCRMITSVDVCILKVHENVDPCFIVFALSSQNYLSWMSATCRGGTRDRVSRSMLGSVRVPIPAYSEQTAIATFLDHKTAQTDTLIDKVQTSIDLLREKRSALITAAVTGKIDVREKAA